MTQYGAGGTSTESMRMQRWLCWLATILLFVPCTVLPYSAHTARQAPVADSSFAKAPADTASAVSFARAAALRALNFRQGDRDGFAGARAAFTETAWEQFIKGMAAFLDPNGVPTFSSSFVPSTDGRVVDEQNGVVHVRIPGTLTQTQNQSRTAYRRFAVDVWAGGRPISVQRMTQTTCVGASQSCN
jgi:hypothetical protein